jgi:ABC-2 type transport system ATP-binding protein
VNDLAISIRGVNKSFGSTQAVRDLSLDVPAGSLCGFLGPNGAGKSTTIRMIMSIIYPDSGTISVLGGDALHNKDRIGFLPEERGLYRKMRVGEFLQYIARLKSISPAIAPAGVAAHVRQWLDRIDLPEVFHKRCQELSKGMQQKVQFLAAIIHEPDLIILDEPFSGLDPVNSAIMADVIRDLHTRGKTVIFSTHVLPQAEELCDRIFLINRGVKLLDATIADIHRRFDPRTILIEPMTHDIDPCAVEGVIGAHRIRNNGVVELTLEEDADPQRVMRAMLNRYPLRSVELRRPTLTDVFVQLVKQDQGAAAAALAQEELTNA